MEVLYLEGAEAMDRIILREDAHREYAINRVRAAKLGMEVIIQPHKKNRSLDQNRLQRRWCNEISEQLGDQTPEEVRGFTKLTVGVPIMREEDDEFCEKYDRIIKPHTYEQKLEMMMEPLDFPITRLMTVKQKTRYLDGMAKYWTQHGVRLSSNV